VRLRSLRFRLLCTLFLLFLLVPPVLHLRAQDSVTIVSVAVPDYTSDVFTPDLFTGFENDHPSVKVQVVKPGNAMYYGAAAFDPDKFFTDAAKYASSADVLYVDNYSISAEATRAGDFLDLAPFVNSDATLNSDDFIPAAWQSFQWDKRYWALPISADVVLLSYDPAAFDKVGLAHPDGNWTLDDLINAARKLTQKDSSGKVIQPGIIGWNDVPLFRSLLGQGFYDDSMSPNPPKLDNPALEPLLDTWAKFQADGLSGADFQGDYNSVPIRIDQSFSLAQQGNDRPRSGALLPGGKAGLSVQGFAVSGGTQSPDLAYALAKYLTSNIKVASRFFGLIPARKSLADAVKADSTHFQPKFSPENEKLLEQALATALPASEYRYGYYLDKALADMRDKKIDAHSALQNAQDLATTIMKQADAQHTTTKAVAVATIPPTAVLKAGEVSIKFDLVAYISPLPNKAAWDKVIKDFTDSDREVRQIVFDTAFSSGLSDLASHNDCFVLPYNAVSDSASSALLSLDPFLSADPTFDKNDLIGNALAPLRRADKTWGLPMYMQPQVLRYNSDLFAKAGVNAPDNDWTIDAFNDALKALKVNPGDPPVLVPQQFGGTYLLMLIAAYGGLPLDIRVTPHTVNFTDPATITAIQQVLDLARKGYIKYQKLAVTGGGMGGGGPEQVPIYTDSISMMNFYRDQNQANGKNPYKTINYPRGTKFSPVAFDLGVGYISAQATNPEACYRWLSTLMQHPELFSAMPVRRSLLDSPALAAQGKDLVDFYKAIDARIAEPGALVFSQTPTGAALGDFITEFFLDRAFDGYVLQDANLENGLRDAERFAKSYQSCVAGIGPDTSTTQEEQNAYYKQYIDCATKVDPTLKSLLGQ